MRRKCNKRTGFILITLVIPMLILASNSIFFKSLLRNNYFNADNANGDVMSSLVFGLNGYEMNIYGNGKMSEYTPLEWTKNLINLSSGWKISIKKVTFSDGVTSISSGLFSGCSKLNTVHIPRSMKEIGTKAFAYCNALENIYYQGTIKDFLYIVDNSPFWCSESNISFVVCTDGIYYLQK